MIALGSNIAPDTNLPRAVGRLAGLGQVLAVSRAYASAAIGPAGQPEFVNAAVLLDTSLPPEQLWSRLRRIEAEMGRVRSSDRYAARPIDLDLVLVEGRVTKGRRRLPDPDLLERAYLAVTVAEVLPDSDHPVSGEPLRAIADRLRPGAALTPRPDIDLTPESRR